MATGIGHGDNHCLVGLYKEDDNIGKPAQQATSNFLLPCVIFKRSKKSGVATNPIQRMLELSQKLIAESRLLFLVMQGGLRGLNLGNREDPDVHCAVLRFRCSAKVCRVRARTTSASSAWISPRPKAATR